MADHAIPRNQHLQHHNNDNWDEETNPIAWRLPRGARKDLLSHTKVRHGDNNSFSSKNNMYYKIKRHSKAQSWKHQLELTQKWLGRITPPSAWQYSQRRKKMSSSIQFVAWIRSSAYGNTDGARPKFVDRRLNNKLQKISLQSIFK